ncbi:MFS transporter [Nocardia sp. NPDC005746]|uniref:MFS transporter n=1 Tax=Nocardia sp. NPDC005746 TaxID=3157062 RepID=UPI003403B266
MFDVAADNDDLRFSLGGPPPAGVAAAMGSDFRRKHDHGVSSVGDMELDVIPSSREWVLRTPTVWFMAFAAALGTASMYPLYPAIAELAESLQASTAAAGTALACGPIGYLVGLALLVPLVDRYAARAVVSVQFAALAAVLAATAAVGSPWPLGLAVGLVGAGSSIGAQLSSVAGRFAASHKRATVLGIVTAGISAGILAGRIVGGWLTDVVGWRGMLLVFAAACVGCAVAARVALPAAAGTATAGYLATLRGMPALFTRHPALRLAAIRGSLWFFAFCAIWAGLAVALSQPPFSYSPERIGLYAVAGILGIIATRIAGTWTDRIGARQVILLGLPLAIASTAILAVTLSNTALTLLCLGLFDAGLFAAQVANQSTVLAIDPTSPARFISAYMVVYFIGGSLGTAFGAAAVGWFGWTTTAMAAATATILAAIITALTGRVSTRLSSPDGLH